MATYAIGDPHGCIDELQELVAKLNYRPGIDTIIILGDYIDRGPDPAAVAEFCRNFRGIRGNHEAKMNRWFMREAQRLETGRENNMKAPDPERLAQWNAISEDSRKWLAELPIYDEVIPGWLAVHAGFENPEKVPVEKQKEDTVIRVRYIDRETGRFKGYQNGTVDQPPNTVYWTEQWSGSSSVVYGHAVHSLTTPRVDRRPNGVECWGIDTGCCFGGHLTSMTLETREVVQVKARRQYEELPKVME